MDAPAALAFAADGATSVAAAFNAAWLLQHRLRDARRRFAAITLATVNAGICVQAAFAQALFATHHFGASTEPFFASPAWLMSRTLLLAGTLLLSALILRRSRR